MKKRWPPLDYSSVANFFFYFCLLSKLKIHIVISITGLCQEFFAHFQRTRKREMVKRIFLVSRARSLMIGQDSHRPSGRLDLDRQKVCSKLGPAKDGGPHNRIFPEPFAKSNRLNTLQAVKAGGC